MQEDISVPDYYSKFSCIGATCEDTCCSGWNVGIDRDTYHEYQQSQHKVLAPLIKVAIVKNVSPSADDMNNFAVMKMKSDGGCHFQQQDKLCAIQHHLGEQSLSDTCRIYPRYFNQFGTQRENALGISCPEAARLILLNPLPMQFGTLTPTPQRTSRPFTSYRFPLQGDGDPQQIEVLNDFRALIIAILQFREISLGARMMLLGWLLEDVDTIVSCETFSHASALRPVLASIFNMLAQPAALEAQFAQIQPNISRKLEIMTQLIVKSLSAGASIRFNECLLAAAQGLAAQDEQAHATDANLVRQYAQNYDRHYRPFFQNKDYIFENYLVNQVICRLFPFTRGTYLDLYRELVFNLSILQVLLVGMAAKYEGLNDTYVIQLFQSFARKSDHKRNYLDTLREAVCADPQDSFVHIMWLLKETA
jgi:lysine-N-methylase